MACDLHIDSQMGIEIIPNVRNGLKPFPNEGNASNVSLKQNPQLHIRVRNGLKPFPTIACDLHARAEIKQEVVGNGFKPFPNDGEESDISFLDEFFNDEYSNQTCLKQNSALHTHVGNGLKPFRTEPFPTDAEPPNNVLTTEKLESSPKIHSLSEIIRGFKTFSSRRINEIADFRFHWQKSFHDHIVRNQKSLEYIRNYVVHNPATWNKDSINPKNLK